MAVTLSCLLSAVVVVSRFVLSWHLSSRGGSQKTLCCRGVGGSGCHPFCHSWAGCLTSFFLCCLSVVVVVVVRVRIGCSVVVVVVVLVVGSLLGRHKYNKHMLGLYIASSGGVSRESEKYVAFRCWFCCGFVVDRAW